MKIISRMHKKCQKCSKRDTCNDKRMEACGMLEMPQNIIINISPQNNQANIEDITKNIQKELERSIQCGFMR